MCNVPFCRNWHQRASEQIMEQDPISIMVDFVPRLRACRKRMGLTQAEFAKVAGVGLGAQNRYESGATEPGASYFAHLLQAGVDIIWLLTGEQSAGSVDAATSAIAIAVEPLPVEQRYQLADILTSLRGMPAQARSARDFRPELPSEAALLEAFEAWLSATPGLTLDELPHELATQLPTILEGAADELTPPASARAAAPPAPPAASGVANRAGGRARRS